jgi:hypothetical protein
MTLGASAAGPDQKLAVRFKNFEYPFVMYEHWPNDFEWQRIDVADKIRLVDGRWRDTSNESDLNFCGLTLESVKFADVTSDGRNEAIVVLRYDTGGTQYSHYVYIYSLQGSAPKLLAYFHSGDRAAMGLSDVYAQKGNLVVELFDPAKRQGDCCSTGIIRKRFHWNDSVFHQVGKDELGVPKRISRIAVDMLGQHH